MSMPQTEKNEYPNINIPNINIIDNITIAIFSNSFNKSNIIIITSLYQKMNFSRCEF